MSHSLQAIIFDFNGVLADDESPHFLSFQQALREEGIHLCWEDYYGTYLGMDERNCTIALLTAATGSCDRSRFQRIVDRKATLFRDTLERLDHRCFRAWWNSSSWLGSGTR